MYFRFSFFRFFFPFIVIAFFFTNSLTAQSLNLDSLIQEHFKARGGLERLLAIKSVSMKGKASVGSVYGDYAVYIKRPNLIRIDLVAPNTVLQQAFDGSRAWIYAPNNGISKVEDMNLSDKNRLIKEADIDGPFMNYQEKGIQLQYEGLDLVEGKQTHHIKLILPEGGSKHIYLDTKSLLSVKEASYRTVKGNSPVSTNIVKMESLFEGYTNHNGILMPKVITTYMDSNLLSILKIDSVEFDSIQDDLLFTPKGLPEN
jgi:outer membrane lipoprotein-sorting protein